MSKPNGVRILDAFRRAWQIKETRLNTGGFPLEKVVDCVVDQVRGGTALRLTGHLHVDLLYDNGIISQMIIEEKVKVSP